MLGCCHPIEILLSDEKVSVINPIQRPIRYRKEDEGESQNAGYRITAYEPDDTSGEMTRDVAKYGKED